MNQIASLHRVRASIEVNNILAAFNFNLSLRVILKDIELVILLGPFLLRHLGPHEYWIEIYNSFSVVQYLLVEFLDIILSEKLFASDFIDLLACCSIQSDKALQILHAEGELLHSQVILLLFRIVNNATNH